MLQAARAVSCTAASTFVRILFEGPPSSRGLRTTPSRQSHHRRPPTPLQGRVPSQSTRRAARRRCLPRNPRTPSQRGIPPASAELRKQPARGSVGEPRVGHANPAGVGIVGRGGTAHDEERKERAVPRARACARERERRCVVVRWRRFRVIDAARRGRGDEKRQCECAAPPEKVHRDAPPG